MFHVTIYKNKKKEYVGFQTEGHAGYAEAGSDIVCAAASVLVINTINAIEAFTDDQALCVGGQRKDLLHYELKGSPSKEADLLLKTMVLGLSEMAHDENYAQYIDLTFEEV
ncbi:MAG: ribosomal-processing cysteine protease Prp [Lachnospiraceae bacterium]